MAMSAVSNFLNNLKQFCRIVCVVQCSCCTGGDVKDADADASEEAAKAEAETTPVHQDLLAQHLQHRITDGTRAPARGDGTDARSDAVVVPVRWDKRYVRSYSSSSSPDRAFADAPTGSRPDASYEPRRAYRYGAIHAERDEASGVGGSARRPAAERPVLSRGPLPDVLRGDQPPHDRAKPPRRQRMRTLTSDTTVSSAPSSLRATLERDEHRYQWLSRFFSAIN